MRRLSRRHLTGQARNASSKRDVTALLRATSGVAAASNCTVLSAAEKRRFSAGEDPFRQLSLRPVATGAIVDVTKQLEHLA